MRRQALLPVLVLATSTALGSAPAIADATAVLHVAPGGRGSVCTERLPCDLDAARAVVQQRIRHQRAELVVQLAGGTYRLRSTWTFGPEDSGTGGHTVVWQAAPGATPVVSGARQVTGWRRTDERTDLWVAPIPAGADSRQLYVDGTRAPVAQGVPPVALTRTPTGFTAATDAYGRWRRPSDLEFVFTGGNGAWTESRCRVARVDGRSITMRQPCWNNIINRPKPATQAPYFFPDLGADTTPNRIENAYELLQPGHWYLDRVSHQLYYAPVGGRDPRRSEVELPALQSLVAGTGTPDRPVHHVTLRGLQFSYATWVAPSGDEGFAEIQANIRLTGDPRVRPQGGCDLTVPAGTCPFGANSAVPGNVSWRGAHDVVLEGNTFSHLGAAGLVVEAGSQDNRIVGNVFTDISSAGIRLGSTDDPHPADVGADDREINDGNRIENNLIHHIGAEYPGADGMLLLYSRHTTVAHNHVRDVPWDGIDSGANAGHVDTADHPDVTSNINADNTIADNLVHDYHSVLADGGAIYLEGHQGETIRRADGTIDEQASFSHGTQVTGNVVYDDRNSGLTLYNDIGSQWITWRHNIEFNNSAGNGGCAPVGHIRFTDNYYADPISVYPCAPASIDLQYSGNHEMPLRPSPGDVPLDILATAGLEPAYRHLDAGVVPSVRSISPRTPTAGSTTDVLITGIGFSGARVSFAGIPALTVRVLSTTFLVATAPADTNLSEATVTTTAGSSSGPSGLPLLSATADSMDDENFWRVSFTPYNVVDNDISSFWSSAGGSMPHWVQVRFTRPVALSKVVVRVRRLDGIVMPDLSLTTSVGGGPAGDGGSVTGNTAADIPFTLDPAKPVDTVRITVRGEIYQSNPRNNADIAQLDFFDANGNQL